VIRPARVEPTVSAWTPRAMCPRCRRPTTVCYCAAIEPLSTATRVMILQHPRERDVPIGTARMASLCLPNAVLRVGVRWDDDPALAAVLADPARPPILLYPGPGARDILREPPTGPVTLVVVDGTWSQAKTVVRDNAVLRALPRYAFRAPEPSQYRIRKEPDDAYCSTIEALMHVLGVLERDPDRFRALLAPFRAMVDAQLVAQAAAPKRRLRQPRGPRPPRPTAPAFVRERWDDLVLVYGEANAWPYRGPTVDHPNEELVHWLAIRPATGDRFEMIARPETPLSPSTPFHIGLDEPTLRAGASQAELVSAFARFVRPADLACSWGFYSRELLRAAGADLPAFVDMRAATHQLLSRKIGSLDAYAATFGPPPPPLGAGRGGRRLALLAQILQAWSRAEE